VDDDPITIELAGKDWNPRNFGDEYLGTTTLRRALTKSANAATIRVSQSVGLGRVVETARRAGIASPLGTAPSLALGAYEVTPLELVAAYAPFANGGTRVEPRLVTRIADADGRVLWEAASRRTPVMDPRDAFLLTSMLRSAVDEGTGRAIREWGVRDPVAGKTGTTNGGTDVWFVGYTPTVVAGFWFGHDTPRPIGGDASGGRLAAPAWAEFYANGWRERNADWPTPQGLMQRRVDASNGLLANEYCRGCATSGSAPAASRRAPATTTPSRRTTTTGRTRRRRPAPSVGTCPSRRCPRRPAKRARRWFDRVFRW
jgi:penicillin-binding protein 1A